MPRAVAPRWLDRRIAAAGPYLALCLSEAEYLAAMRHLRISDPDPWVNDGADATVHHVRSPKGGLCCIVCMHGHEQHSPVEVAGMLVHEAVHVWQQYAEEIGEHHPAREQEAYAIQAIAQELMAEFARRMGAV